MTPDGIPLTTVKSPTELTPKGLLPPAIPAPTTFRAPDGKTRMRMPNSKYSDALAREVCRRLMGKEALKNICKDPRMPTMKTVIGWLAHPKLIVFREMYYYSRRVQAELFIDEIIEISDNDENDWKPTYKKNGEQNGWKPDNEAIQRSRVRIDTRKWYASRMVPRLYGDRQQVDHDVTGDLAELLKKASNQDDGLPPVIEHE